jgi:hypothetical protein
LDNFSSSSLTLFFEAESVIDGTRIPGFREDMEEDDEMDEDADIRYLFE